MAQNTVEDVKQEWEHLEVSLNGHIVFSSDSLQRLDSLVSSMLDEHNSKRLLPTVLREINTVNSRLDHIR